jgi:hypothetical protein
MMIRKEEITWQRIIAMYGLLAACLVIAGVDAVRNRIEKVYFWVKYRNFRYDK